MRIGAPVKRITGIRSGKASWYLCALRGFEAEVDLDGLEVLLLLVLTTPNQIKPPKKPMRSPVGASQAALDYTAISEGMPLDDTRMVAESQGINASDLLLFPAVSGECVTRIGGVEL